MLAFTSDAKDRWSAQWLTGDGYAKFWPQAVRETTRKGGNGDLELEVEKQDDRAMIRVTALDDGGGFRNRIDAGVRVVAPSGQTGLVDLHQSGPGLYERS